MSSDEDSPEKPEKPETITTTIEINKDLFLKFKALCVLNETTISGEIEKLIRKRTEQMTISTYTKKQDRD
jgi:hypothetical protein